MSKRKEIKPNKETIEAIEAARRGETVPVDNINDIFNDLDDEETFQLGVWDYEEERSFYEELKIEKEAVSKTFMETGLIDKVTFTGCLIPKQIMVVLKTGEMCYGRNSRVGGDVTMWVFEKECDLAKGWPDEVFKGVQKSDAWTYTVIAKEMISLIGDYLKQKESS